MKSLFILVALAVASITGCGTVDVTTHPGPGSSAEPGHGSGGPAGQLDPGCVGDHCFCSLATDCTHDCAPGGESCEVQCHPGEPCDVGCAAGEHCHVECSDAASCDVDCGASPECHVTCPASGCTVRNCVGAGCQVTCGTAIGSPSLPTHAGATATCP